MSKTLRTVRVIDLTRDPMTGEKIALSPSELVPCVCCGKGCGKLHELNTGHRVGSECASLLETLSAHGGGADWARILQASKKQIAFFAVVTA
jgi:hypothetical protein